MSYFTEALLAEEMNTVAVIKAYYGAIVTALSGSGWTQTSDTGQVTISSIASTTPPFGYQMWQMNDTLQATSPFFVRIYYSSSAGPYWQPQIVVQVGIATDGAGNFTGLIQSPPINLSLSSAGTAGNYCYYTGDTNRFAMALTVGPVSSQQVMFGIERTKSSSGTDTSTGVMIFAYNSFGTKFSMMLPYAVAPTTALAQWPAAFNLAQPTMANGTYVGMACPIPFNVQPYNPGYNFLLYNGSDWPYRTVQTITIYGAPHNYVILTPGISPTNPVGPSVMMRYE